MKAFLVIGTPSVKDLQKARNNLMVVLFVEQDNRQPDQYDKLVRKMTDYVAFVESDERYCSWIKNCQNIHFYGITPNYHEVIKIFKDSVKTLNKK